jgi:hypothetical protein
VLVILMHQLITTWKMPYCEFQHPPSAHSCFTGWYVV